MDRDFIMTLRSDALPRAFAVSVPDKGCHVVLAGFTPRFAAAAPARFTRAGFTAREPSSMARLMRMMSW